MTRMLSHVDSIEAWRSAQNQPIVDNQVEEIKFIAYPEGVAETFKLDLGPDNARLLQKAQAELDAHLEDEKAKYDAVVLAARLAYTEGISEYIEAARWDRGPVGVQSAPPAKAASRVVHQSTVKPPARVSVMRSDEEKRALVAGYYGITVKGGKAEWLRQHPDVVSSMLYTWHQKFLAEDAEKAKAIKPAKATKVKATPAMVEKSAKAKPTKSAKALAITTKPPSYWVLSNEDKAYVRTWCRENNRPVQDGGYVKQPHVIEALAARDEAGKTSSAPPALFQSPGVAA